MLSSQHVFHWTNATDFPMSVSSGARLIREALLPKHSDNGGDAFAPRKVIQSPICRANLGKKATPSETVSVLNYRKHGFYANGGKKPAQKEGSSGKSSASIPCQSPDSAIPEA